MRFADEGTPLRLAPLCAPLAQALALTTVTFVDLLSWSTGPTTSLWPTSVPKGKPAGFLLGPSPADGRSRIGALSGGWPAWKE